MSFYLFVCFDLFSSNLPLLRNSKISNLEFSSFFLIVLFSLLSFENLFVMENFKHQQFKEQMVSVMKPMCKHHLVHQPGTHA